MINESVSNPPQELTEREREILRMVATGKSNKEIASLLFISSNTVKVHLSNIYPKIGVTTRTEAAMYAVKANMVEGLVAPLEAAAAPPLDRPQGKYRRWFIALAVSLLLVISGFAAYLLSRPKAPLVAQFTPSAQKSASRWQTLPGLNILRSGAAMVVYEDSIYVIGGEGAGGVSSANERYDTSSGTWSESASMPLAVTDVNAAVIGGLVYVPGGRAKNSKMTASLQIYDPRSDQWKQGASMPSALSGYSLVSSERRLYVFGGLDDSGECVGSVYIYDPDSNAWTSGTPMPVKRAFTAAAAVGDRIFVMGGSNGEKPLNLNEIYSPNLEGLPGAWAEDGTMPSNRYGMGMTSIANILYLLGGIEDGAGGDSAMAYIPQSDTWQGFESPPQKLEGQVRLVTSGEYIYAFGFSSASGGQFLRYQAIYSITLPKVP